METKESAVKRLFEDYTDCNGRITLRNKNFSDPRKGIYDSENQALWTGEAGILLSRNRLYDERYARNTLQALTLTNVDNIPGLYSRQPGSEKGDNTVSHDEYNGICYQAAVVQSIRKVVNDIVDYGEAYDWCFLDTYPKVKPLKKFLFNPLQWINAMKVIKNKELRSKYPIIYQLSHIRQPDERAFYRIVSKKHKPSKFGLLFLAAGIAMSAFKPKESTSGKLMAWYKLQAIDLVHFSSPILNFAKKVFYGKLIKTYGENYLEEIHRIYFRDPKHPFHTLVKGLK